jgi:F-type H+-transporting ATPase subunit epsilon
MSDKKLHLEIVTPSRPILDEKVVSISVPGELGGFQVLYNHAPILSTLKIGVMKIEFANGETKRYAVSGGTIEVQDNHIVLLAESVESEDEIDVDRAKAALERAKKRLAEKRQTNVDVARAESALSRAVNRLKLKNVAI